MLLKGTLVFYILFLVFCIIRRARKTNLRFAIKEQLNISKPLVILPFACYFAIGTASILPAVTSWTNEQLLRLTPNSNSYFVVSWTPYIAIITTFYFVYRIANYGLKPWFKYTEKEQLWIEESKVKTKQQMNKIKVFLHLPINKTGGLQ